MSLQISVRSLSNFAIILSLFVVTSIAGAETTELEQTDRENIINQVVENWIAVAEKQYERAMYNRAQTSLLRAAQYQEYLTSKQQERIDNLMEKVRQAIQEKQMLLEQLKVAEELASQDQLLEAKAKLKSLSESKLLSEIELQKVKSALERVEAQIEVCKKEMAELFKKSRADYEAGKIEEAREGFVKVAESGLYVPLKGMTAEQYLQKINERLKTEQKSPHTNSRSEKSKSFLWFLNKTDKKDQKQTGQDKTSVKSDEKVIPLGTTRTADNTQHINQTRQSTPPEASQQLTEVCRDNIKCSYLKAVVRDAQIKVARYLGDKQFDQAREIVENARLILMKYQQDIPSELFTRLSAELDGLLRMIVQQQNNLVD